MVLNVGTNNLTGTNNARENTPEEIIEGIKGICKFIFSKSDKTSILLMGVFPRGLPTDHFRAKITAINMLLKKFAGTNDQIAFMDIGEKFTDKEGNIDLKLMPDLVHPSTNGYQIWAESIEPVLQNLKFGKN